MRLVPVILVGAALAACSPPATAPSVSTGQEFPAASSLSVAAFSVARRYDGSEFQYTPILAVRETSGTTAIAIRSISFALSGVAVYSGRIAHPDVTIPASETYVFGGAASPHTFTSIDESGTAFVTIDYLDDERRAGRVAATAPVAICGAGCDPHSEHFVNVVVSEFRIVRAQGVVRPRLTVIETAGVFDASIEAVRFELYDLFGGDVGWRDVVGPWHLPAGGRVQLFHEGGDPAAIDIPLPPGEHLLIADVAFADDAGRRRSVRLQQSVGEAEPTAAP
jgi:hypothetical protein